MAEEIIDLKRRLDNIDTWIKQNQTTPSVDIYRPISIDPCPPKEELSPIITL